jgi:predicted transcriptional regulator
LNGKTLKGRSCYGHLGGKLGQRIFERLVELDWIRLEEGKTTVFELTEKGYVELTKLGVNLK